MKTYYVQLPIAGHLSFEIEAASPREAIDKAFDLDPKAGELNYETMESFNSGNVCNCPSPWNPEASEIE